MRRMVCCLNAALSRVFLFALVIALPALAYAKAEENVHEVKALSISSSGALLVLRDNRLLAIEGDTIDEVPLPEAAAGAQLASLARGADGNTYLAGPGLGVWRYDAVDQRWQSLNDTLPDLAITAIAAHATQPETLYAYHATDGMLRSRDGGARWVKVDSGPQEQVKAFLHSDMPGSMESGWLFAGTTRGVARSMDCFCFWGDAGDLRGNVSAISYDPGAPENVYAVIEGQLHHSADGGETWKSLEAPKAVTALAFRPDRGLVVGTASGDLLALDARGQWSPAHD